MRMPKHYLQAYVMARAYICLPGEEPARGREAVDHPLRATRRGAFADGGQVGRRRTGTSADGDELNLLGQRKWGARRLALAFAGLAMGMTLVCLGETVAGQQMSSIRGEFTTSISAVWLEAGFLLTCVMLQPVYIKFAEMFGRARPLFAAVAIFSAFSVLAGAGQSFEAVVVGRALQGAGGAGMMPLTLVVLTDITAAGQRVMWINLLGVAILAGKWAGPVIGALGVEHGSAWRWTYYAPAIWGLLTLGVMAATLRGMPAPPVNYGRARCGKSDRPLWRDFDLLGMILWSAGSLMLLTGLVLGGNVRPWGSAVVLCLVILGTSLLLAFGVVEWKVARWPMVPLRVVGRPRSLLALAGSFFAGMCMYTSVLFIPLIYSTALERAASNAGLQILWCLLGGLVGLAVSTVAGWQHKCYYLLNLVGLAIITVGNGLMMLWNAGEQPALKPAIQVITGFGLGLCIQQMLLAAQDGVPTTDIATVTTLVDYARTFGGMIGLVVGLSILRTWVSHRVIPILKGIPLFSLTTGGNDLMSIDITEIGPHIPVLRKAFPSIVSAAINEAFRGFHVLFILNAIYAFTALAFFVFVRQLPARSL
ncbi:hypothetical protein EV182_000587 [Spiromyces aspiralis]|uniref:Uncharacterized protein n=1 Tax=Spiromyces aspiralis TaxID=68401 RepID=A0ACC1HIB5_9FUNG|nr:hypothetical protein EV182_000587 [Spiromyces aspiralis]